MILIIGAMSEEVDALTSKMNDLKAKLIKDIQVFEGSLNGIKVVVAQSGVGKVNAAFTTTMLISHYSPSHIINIGSAGGLQHGQRVGDIVVANKLQYHDLDIGPNTYNDPRFIFTPNQEMIQKAADLLVTLNQPHHVGLIVTGDQFITKHQPQFAIIQKSFEDAICVEMEAAAIAAVCQRADVPFIVLRSLSDITHHDDNAMTFEEYLHVASENSALICEKFVTKL